MATAYYEFDATLPPEDRLNLHHRSHGESVMHIMDERFTKKGLYILDEPEAGLSPFRLMELLVRITRMAEEGSQFIIATHSPILLAVPDATILEITADGLAPRHVRSGHDCPGHAGVSGQSPCRGGFSAGPRRLVFQQVKQLVAQLHGGVCVCVVPRVRHIHCNVCYHRGFRPVGHDQNTVGQHNRLVHIVSHHDHRASG